MVYTLGANDKFEHVYIITPNHSMSWRGLLAVYSGISAVTLSIGIYFYCLGLPLILPFSGLELIILGAALIINLNQAGRQEVIKLSENRIFVESGYRRPDSRHKFQRPWAKVILQSCENDWYPSKLLIRSHGRQIEIGRFLNEQERKILAGELSQAVRCRGKPGQP